MSRASQKFGVVAVCLFSVLLLVSSLVAQETTGGLQGTVKDPSGAVVSKATVELTGTSLVGKETWKPIAVATIASRTCRLAPIPITVKASGFSELKREGITALKSVTFRRSI